MKIEDLGCRWGEAVDMGEDSKRAQLLCEE